ncbi:hypothetical protein [Spirosoma linguale]|uniref:Uncharacterized protein n=1 Tax=Spirosoma linguale (strain ATCC 33905 / DSM 74 / LMG 10896 / Claus 1) TaxID=504472 RepID=D2QU84_SPILD|nr:hypothetical protein Slin_6408 [Spirosoma linguale DSM 74]
MLDKIVSRRTFVGISPFLASGLYSCIKDGNSSDEAIKPLKPVFAAWGGSSTQGVANTVSYPSHLQQIFPERKIENFGLPSQSSLQIAARQGGVPVTLSIDNDKFNGNNSIPVNSISIKLLSTQAHNLPISITGTVKGVKCKLLRIATGAFPKQVESYSLTPLTPSEAVIPKYSFFIPDDAINNRDSLQILWLGRNDLPDFVGVADVIENCIDYIKKPAQFLVIGILNSVFETGNNHIYKSILNLNSILASKYTENYIPATPPTNEEMNAIKYSPTNQDKIEIAANTFPASMRISDGYHLNTIGNLIIATRVAAKIKEKGW